MEEVKTRNDLMDKPTFGLDARADQLMVHTDAEMNLDVPGVLPVYYLHAPVDKKVARKITETYGVKVVYSSVGTAHPQPNLAVEEMICIDQALHLVDQNGPGATVVAVQGHPALFQARDGKGVWCCSDKAALRPLHMARTNRADSMCHCRFEDCDHVVADELLFVHTLHDYTPTEMVGHILKSQRRIAYAVVHRYPDISGEFSRGEMEYFYANPEIVVLKNRGGQHLHSRKPCNWLDGQPYCTYGMEDGSTAGCFLKSTLVYTCGSTHLYMLTLAAWGDAGFDPPALDFEDQWNPSVLEEQSANHTYTLPSITLGDPSLRHNLTWHDLSFERVRLIPGAVFITGHEKVGVVLSRPILHAAMRLFAGRPRTAALYTAIIRNLNAQYNAVGNLPEDRKYRAVIASAALIMTSQVILETAVLHQMQMDNARLWAVHARAVAFEPQRTFTKTDAVVATLWSGLSALTLKQASSTLGLVYIAPPSHALAVHAIVAKCAVVAVATSASTLSVPLLPVWAACTVLGGAWAAWTKYDVGGTRHRDQMVTQWSTTTPGDRPTPLPVGVYPLGVAPVFGPSDKVKPPVVLHDERYVVTPAPALPKKDIPPKMSMQGIGFSDVIPTYFASTPENEYVALTQRLAKPTPEPTGGLWKHVSREYGKTALVVATRKYLATNPVVITSTQANKYASKFGASQHRELMMAFSEWQETLSIIHQDMATSGFIKVEKLDKSTHDEFDVLVVWDNELAAPRIIISMKPKLSVVFGTIMMQVAEARLRIQLDWEFSQQAPFCPIAPHGCSGEILGQWFESVIHHFGGESNCVFWDQDAEHHDSHTGKDAQEAGRHILVDDIVIHPPAARKVFDAQNCIRGKTHGGVKYKLDYKRGSGFSNTDAENTVITEELQTFAITVGTTYFDRSMTILNGFVELGSRYALGACGDDGGGISERKFFHDKFGTDFKEATTQWSLSCLELGYKVKPHFSYSPDGVDFCSRWWYPTPDGILPGGKIGRVLSRAGWFLDCKDAQTIRGAAIGQLQDNYHVPFLREYFTRVLELTVGQKVRGKPQAWSIHMSKRHEYGPETLAFVSRKYGLEGEDLAEFKQMLAACRQLPIVISWRHLSRCVKIDST